MGVVWTPGEPDTVYILPGKVLKFRSRLDKWGYMITYRTMRWLFKLDAIVNKMLLKLQVRLLYWFINRGELHGKHTEETKTDI